MLNRWSYRAHASGTFRDHGQYGVGAGVSWSLREYSQHAVRD